MQLGFEGNQVALCLLALALTFVPSKLTVSIFNAPIAWAITRICTNTPRNGSTNRFRKMGNRVMVRMRIGRDVAKCHRVVRRLLQLAAGEHPRRISVKQQRHHHRRMARRLPPASIRAFQLTQVEPVHDLHHKSVPGALGEANPATRAGEDYGVSRSTGLKGSDIVNSRHSPGRARILSDTVRQIRQTPKTSRHSLSGTRCPEAVRSAPSHQDSDGHLTCSGRASARERRSARTPRARSRRRCLRTRIRTGSRWSTSVPICSTGGAGSWMRGQRILKRSRRRSSASKRGAEPDRARAAWDHRVTLGAGR